MNCDIAPSAKMPKTAYWSRYIPISEAAMQSRVWDETNPVRQHLMFLGVRCTNLTLTWPSGNAAAVRRHDPGTKITERKNIGNSV